MCILLLCLLSSLFGDKYKIRKTYPEIWEKLQELEYCPVYEQVDSDTSSFPLENKGEILYIACEIED